MQIPARETAQSLSPWELAVEHDDILFGGWSADKQQPRRQKGILERLKWQEGTLKVFGVALAFLVLHALGMPTEMFGKILMSFLPHVITF